MKKIGYGRRGTRIVGIALSVACWGMFAAPEAKAEATGTGAPPAGAAQQGVNRLAPVARVNGVAITRGQLDNMVRQLLAQQQIQISAERLGEVWAALSRQGMELLIGRELLAQEAARRNVEITRSELAQAVEELESNLPEGQSLDQALADQGLTRDTLESDLIRELRVNRLVEMMGEEIAAPDAAQIEGFYQENRDQFRVAEAVHLRHVLIGMMESDTDRVRDVRRRKAEALRRQVVDGSDFANLAMLHSDDATRANGGEVGFVERARLQPALADTAFALRENEVSSVIKSPAGFHILQAGERRPERMIPLDEARDGIREYLLRQDREAAVQELVSTLREAAEIEGVR